MKVIIAGGSGMIGRQLTRRLLEDGHSVWVLSRNPERVKLPDLAEVVKWDGRSSSGWQHLVNEADAIINLTGENLGASRWTPKRKQILRSSRLEPANAIVQAIDAAVHRPTVLLQSSAVGYYGPKQAETVDENTPPGGDELSRLVVDWEDATKPVETFGVRRVVVRQGIVLDNREGALPRMLLPFRLFAGGPVGSGKQWISWISRRDIVEAMLFLLQNENASGAYNLTSPNPVTNAEFGKTIGSVMHRPYWMPVPAFLMRLFFGEMSTVVLDGQRVLPRRLLEAGYGFKYSNLKSALQDVFAR